MKLLCGIKIQIILKLRKRKIRSKNRLSNDDEIDKINSYIQFMFMKMMEIGL